MRARYFLLGMLVGLLLAPTSGSELRARLRDQLALTIDMLLRRLARWNDPAARRTLTAL